MSSSALQIRQAKPMSASLITGRKELLLVILVAIAVMFPAIIFGIPSNRDLSNHFRFALPFYDAIRSGNLFPAWLSDSNDGYGDASFRFYPPGLYYLLTLLRFVTGNWYVATLATFTLISIVGSLGVFLWARTIVPSRLAMWAGILFAVMPYHVNQYYQATLLAEFAATSVLPFCFFFVEKICTNRRIKDVAGLAFSFALLVLTHLPLTVIGSMALAVYALVRLPKQNRLRTGIALSLGVGLGLVATSRFWTTVIWEQAWIRADNILPEPSVDYRINFILSTLSPDNLNVWWMNILLFGTLAMLWPALSLIWSSKPNPDLTPVNGVSLKAPLALFLLTIFMSTPLSRPLWNLVHPLQQTQFPWRWLAITSMVVPLFVAAAIPYWESLAKGKKRPLALVACGSIVISLAFSAAHTVREAKFFNKTVFDKTLQEIPGSRGVAQWWPSWVHEPLVKMQNMVESKEREVTVQTWEPERRSFNLGPGTVSDVRVKTFFYPHWKAYSADVELNVKPAQDGALLITVPENASSVKLEFVEPTRVRIAGVISLVGFLIIIILSFINRPLLSSFRQS